jgi:DNA replication protein DnaC
MNEIGSIQTRQESCEQHGTFEAKSYTILGRSMPWSTCPACAAEEAARQKAADEAKAREARLHAWQRKIGQSGIPERFHDRTLDGFIARSEGQRSALAFAQVYADEFDKVLRIGRSALFVGKPGTGKTHLACGIGLQIMREQNRTVLFSTVMRAIRRVKDSWGRDSRQTESQAIETLVAPDLLILDEVGVQFGSDFERNILFDVLNERYEKRRPTLLLSNLTASEVAAYLGERIMDRLREDGGALLVFDWESHRAKGGAA